MDKKFDFRILSGLLIAAVALLAYFSFRASSKTAPTGPRIASLARMAPLNGVLLSPDIKGKLLGFYIVKDPDRRPSPRYYIRSERSLSDEKMRKFLDIFANDIAIRLRNGKVKFARPSPVTEEGYKPEPSEEERRAASLSFAIDIHRIKDVYCYSVQMQVTHQAYLKPDSDLPTEVVLWSSPPDEGYTSLEAKVIPGLRENIRGRADAFVYDYKWANGMGVLESGVGPMTNIYPDKPPVSKTKK